MSQVNVILHFTKFARYAFNALVGALEEHISDPRLSITGARSFKRLEEKLANADEKDITLVLWTFYSPSFNQAREELQQLKQNGAGQHIIHLAGGVHATAEPEQTLNAGYDYVALGEGEQIIIDFVRQLLANQNPKKIQGIAYLHNGQLKRNGRGALVNLNDFAPFAPQHHMFGAIEITRGCIYACKFCQTPFVSKARFRHRSVENIIHYAGQMRAQGFRDYRFITPTSLSYGSPDESVNPEQIEFLLASLRETLGSEARIFFGSFPSEVRPEHVTPEILKILKRYVDNNNLIIGGQSGSQNVLDSSRRGHSVDSITQAVKLSVQAGFLPNVDFLFGLPDETHEDVQQTMSLAQQLSDLGAKIHNHTFMPLPGTPYRFSAAGNIDEQTQEMITVMESRGQAYGQWKNHIRKAQELVAIRKEKD